MDFNSTIQITGALTDWNTCKTWCAEQHFAHNYQNVELLIWSLAGFTLFFFTEWLLEKNKPNEIDSWKDTKKKESIVKIAYALNEASIIFAFIMQISFLVMWRFGIG